MEIVGAAATCDIYDWTEAVVTPFLSVLLYAKRSTANPVHQLFFTMLHNTRGPWAFVREQILMCFHHLLTSYIFLPLWWALKSISWRGRDFSQETECFAVFLRFVIIKPVKGLSLKPVHKVTFSNKFAALREYSQLSCMNFCSRETRVVEKMFFLLSEKMI